MNNKSSEYTALGISIGVHVVLLIAMALYKFSIGGDAAQIVVETIFTDEREQQEFTQELDINTEISDSLSVVSGATVSTATGGSGAPAVNQQKIEESESMQEPDIKINVSQVSVPGADLLGQDLGESEVKGEVGAVVEGYGSAMSRLTQEIIRLMRTDKVHVVWLFDESDSMKDDREEIRDQFHKVYEELNIAQKRDKDLKKRSQDETLHTTILSYGAGIHTHTPQPISDVEKIQKAIDKVPVDESGKENLLQSIMAVCDSYGPKAFRQKRKLIIVVLTDEAGDDGAEVEAAISRVKKYKCPVYLMGREAIFGYPYARQRWVDPKYKLSFWINVRRGPETAFPEALQYDGLHGRWDSFSSGFGCYEQVRLARESGGIYFLLPGDEENLSGAGAALNRKFDFLAMKEYQPLLLARREYDLSRKKSKFRSSLWDVIQALNPATDKKLSVREIWYDFEPEKFAVQGKDNGSKALRAFGILNKVIMRLEEIKPLRAKEDSMRWRAAFDLCYAQCLAYRVRLFQFMLAVDSHMKNPPKPNNPIANRWNARRTKKLREPDAAQIRKTQVDMEVLNKQMEIAKVEFRSVIENHPGTPWAQRANWELNSGFGFDFVDTYRDPKYDTQRKNIKVPKF